MDELIQVVVQRAGISSAQASLAVEAILAYLAARLPSPVVGRIREQMREVRGPHQPDSSKAGAK